MKEGRIEFDRCICHINSLQKLNAANLGRILGPKGLMPSVKLGTVTKDVRGSVTNLMGASEYREKLGVIRLAVGQLGFTPEQMQNNLKVLIGNVKKDLALLSEKINKEIHEVVSCLVRRLSILASTLTTMEHQADLLSWVIGIELNPRSWFQPQWGVQEPCKSADK